MAFSVRKWEGHIGRECWLLKSATWPSAWRVHRCWPKCFCTIFRAAEVCRFRGCGEQGKVVTRATLTIFRQHAVFTKHFKKVLTSLIISLNSDYQSSVSEKGYLKLIPVWYWLVTVKLITLISETTPKPSQNLTWGTCVWPMKSECSFSLGWNTQCLSKAKGKCVWECVSMCVCVHRERKWDGEREMG